MLASYSHIILFGIPHLLRKNKHTFQLLRYVQSGVARGRNIVLPIAQISGNFLALL